MEGHGMSKRHEQKQPEVIAPKPVQAVTLKTAEEPVITALNPGRRIEDHRHCPICWERCKGYGTAYSTSPNGKTYYRCNQSLTQFPPCGHTWSAVVTLHSVTIEHKTVRLDGER